MAVCDRRLQGTVGRAQRDVVCIWHQNGVYCVRLHVTKSLCSPAHTTRQAKARNYLRETSAMSELQNI